MAMPTCYSIFLNESIRKQQQKAYQPIDISRQKIDDAQAHQQYFLLVGTDIDSWLQIKLFVDVVHFYMELTDEGLGIYPIWKYIYAFLPTLDGSASILRPK